jgi:hypothetical protein
MRVAPGGASIPPRSKRLIMLRSVQHGDMSGVTRSNSSISVLAIYGKRGRLPSRTFPFVKRRKSKVRRAA